MKQSVRPWITALGIVPVALLLAGCFGGPSLPGGPGGGDDPTEDELVEDIVEGSGDGVDFESGALPEDFPEDVPLVPGEIGPSMSISNGMAWTATVYAADEATANSAPDLLEAAGFTNDAQFYWENEKYIVILVGIQETEDGKWAVSYQIQAQE